MDQHAMARQIYNICTIRNPTLYSTRSSNPDFMIHLKQRVPRQSGAVVCGLAIVLLVVRYCGPLPRHSWWLMLPEKGIGLYNLRQRCLYLCTADRGRRASIFGTESAPDVLLHQDSDCDHIDVGGITRGSEFDGRKSCGSEIRIRASSDPEAFIIPKVVSSERLCGTVGVMQISGSAI